MKEKAMIQNQVITGLDWSQNSIRINKYVEVRHSRHNAKTSAVKELVGKPEVISHFERVAKHLDLEETLGQIIEFQVCLSTLSPKDRSKPSELVNATKWGEKYPGKDQWKGIAWHTVKAPVNLVKLLIESRFILRYGIKEGGNDKKDFVGLWATAFDLDNDPSIDWKQTKEIAEERMITPGVIHYSTNGTPENNKLRLIIFYDEFITDYDRASNLQCGLNELFPNAAPAIHDPCRIYYPTVEEEVCYHDLSESNSFSLLESTYPYTPKAKSINRELVENSDDFDSLDITSKVNRYIDEKIIEGIFNGDLVALIKHICDDPQFHELKDLKTGNTVHLQFPEDYSITDKDWEGESGRKIQMAPIIAEYAQESKSKSSFDVTRKLNDEGLALVCNTSGYGAMLVNFMGSLSRGLYNEPFQRNFYKTDVEFTLDYFKTERFEWKSPGFEDQKVDLPVDETAIKVKGDFKCRGTNLNLYDPIGNKVGNFVTDPRNLVEIFGLKDASDLAYFDNMFHFWNGKYWEPSIKTRSLSASDRDIAIEKRLQEVLFTVESQRKKQDQLIWLKCYNDQASVNEAIRSLKKSQYVGKAIKTRDPDSDYIEAIYNTQTGVVIVDKDGDRFISHEASKSLYLTSILSWGYDESQTDYTIADECFAIFSEDQRDRLRSDLAITLEPSSTAKKIGGNRAVLIQQEQGDGGKKSLETIFRLMHGADQISSVGMEAYQKTKSENNNTVDVSGVLGKRGNVANEYPAHCRLFSSEIFKLDTAHDVRNYRMHREHPFSGRFIGFMWLFGNHVPLLDQDLKFAKKRLSPYKIDKTYCHPHDYDPNNPNHMKADTRYNEIDFLLSIIPTLFNWMLERRRAIMKGEHEYDTSHVDEYFEEISGKFNHLRLMISDAFKINPQATIGVREFYNIYRAWLILEGYAGGTVMSIDDKKMITSIASADTSSIEINVYNENGESDPDASIDYSRIKTINCFDFYGDHPKPVYDEIIKAERMVVSRIEKELTGIVWKSKESNKRKTILQGVEPNKGNE